MPPSLRNSIEQLNSMTRSRVAEAFGGIPSLTECDSIELMQSLETLSSVNRSTMAPKSEFFGLDRESTVVRESVVASESLVEMGEMAMQSMSTTIHAAPADIPGVSHSQFRSHSHWSCIRPNLKAVEKMRLYLEGIPEYHVLRSQVQEQCSRESGAISLASRSLGNDRIAIVALALLELGANSSLRAMNVCDNRLTDVGISSFMEVVADVPWESLSELNLSDNTVGTQCLEYISAFIESCECLQELILARVSLTGSHLAILAKGLKGCGSLRRLDLSGNAIDDDGLAALAAAMTESPPPQLRRLDLSFNKIRGKGIIALSLGLAEVKSLIEIDVSWNSLGSSDVNQEKRIADAVGQWLAGNTTLLHLNLAHTQMSARQISILGEYLDGNNTLLGMHVDGIEAKINAFGDLLPCTDPWSTMEQHSQGVVASGVSHFDMEHNTHVICDARNACWICLRWTHRRVHRRVLPKEIDGLSVIVAAALDAKRTALREKAMEDAAKKKGSKGRATKGAPAAAPTPPSPTKPTAKAAVRYCDVEVFMLASFDDWEPQRLWFVEDDVEEDFIVTGGAGTGDVSGRKASPKAKKDRNKRPKINLQQAIPEGKTLTFDATRLMPPGTHYVLWRLNEGGSLSYDPNQPHRPSEELRSAGIQLPPDAPAFCNVLAVGDPHVDDSLPTVMSDLASEAGLPCRPRVRNTQGAAKEGGFWLIEESVFYAEMGRHSAAHHNRVHLSDWEVCKAKKLYRDNRTVSAEIESVMVKHAWRLHCIFLDFTTLYSSELFFMTVTAYNELLTRCHILELKTHVAAAPPSHPPAVQNEMQEMDIDGAVTDDNFESELRSAASVAMPVRPEVPRSSFRPTVRRQSAISHAPSLKRNKTTDLPILGPATVKTRRSSVAPGIGAASSVAPLTHKESRKPTKRPLQSVKPLPGGPKLATLSIGFDRTEAEMVFIAACISGPRVPSNSKRSLSRVQFLDVLLAVATSKFYNTKECSTIATALDRLIMDHLIPKAHYHDAVAFRERYCLYEGMDKKIKIYRADLDYAFKLACDEDDFMTFDEWTAFVAKHMEGVELLERQFKCAFMRSMAIPEDPFDDEVLCHVLTRTEFYEALVRVAVQWALRQVDSTGETEGEEKYEDDESKEMNENGEMTAKEKLMTVPLIEAEEKFEMVAQAVASNVMERRLKEEKAKRLRGSSSRRR